MSARILVLHGPNLARRAMEEFNPRLEAQAHASATELVIGQANGEEGLLDLLWSNVDGVRAVIVNAGAIAVNAHALAEGLAMTRLRAVEVASRNVQSALSGSVERRFVGESEAYLKALVHLVGEAETVKPSRHVKTIGRAHEAPRSRVTEAISRRGKTIGRERETTGEHTVTQPARGRSQLLRAQVKERIVARLKGKTTVEELTSWAREQWSSMQSGARAEAGAEQIIEAVLLALMSGASGNDGALITQMARLDA